MILFQLAAAFLAGVALAALGAAEAWPLPALGGAGLSLGLLLAGRRAAALAVALIVLLALAGIDRYESSLPPDQPGGIALLNDSDETVTLRGVVADEPQEGDRSQRFRLHVEAVERDGGLAEVEGEVEVTARPYPAYEYGDVLLVTGRLETPPVFEGFDYRAYLARKGVTSQVLFPAIEAVGRDKGSELKRALIDARRPLSEALKQALPEPESALARGILLGQRASIPDELTDEMNRAGISHLVAISGQNVAIVAGVIMASLTWLIGRRPAVVVAIVLVVAYALFVGASPSVMRAALMAIVMLGATLAGRPGSSLGAITLAAALLAAWQPLIVEDVAFQLSFAATLGIVLAARPIEDVLRPALSRFPGGAVGVLVAENAAITASASLAVLPIIAGSFGRLSLVSLPANLLAAPAFVLALGGSLLTAVAGFIDGDLGLLAGALAYLPLAFLTGLAHFAAGLPLASVEVRGFGLLESILSYALLGVAALYVVRLPPRAEEESRWAPALRPALGFSACLVLAAVFVWYGALQPQSHHLRVTVLDVGQGDAILVETPGGQRILVDGGPSGPRITQALGRVLDPTERRIDLIVLSHPQDDHVTGLIDVLRRYEVGAVLSGSLAGRTAAYREWRDELEAQGIEAVTPAPGQWIDIGDSARIEVLAPPLSPISGTEDDLNNNSLVLRLVYGEASFLLTGDLAAEGEAALLESSFDLHATVLKVGHHGSDGASTPAFLDAVQPEVAVISTGAENTYGHPSPTTRLNLAGVPLLRTDENGDVRFETDGASLWVEFQRGGYSLLPAGTTR